MPPLIAELHWISRYAQRILILRKATGISTSSLLAWFSHHEKGTCRAPMQANISLYGEFQGVCLACQGRLTKTFFALQTLHARFRTVPSACTTSGANSIPNLCSGQHSKSSGKTEGKGLTFDARRRPLCEHIFHLALLGYRNVHQQLRAQFLGLYHNNCAHTEVELSLLHLVSIHLRLPRHPPRRTW